MLSVISQQQSKFTKAPTFSLLRSPEHHRQINATENIGHKLLMLPIESLLF